jgi:hypothetical protein
MARGDRVDLVHVRGLPVEGHRHDRARTRRNRGLEFPGVDVGGVRLGIHVHRLCGKQHDHLGGGGEGERGGDDLVARLDVQRHEGDEERIGPARNSHAVSGADISRQALLELRDLRSEDVLAVVEDRLDACVDRLAQQAVLSLEVDEVHDVQGSRREYAIVGSRSARY